MAGFTCFLFTVPTCPRCSGGSGQHALRDCLNAQKQAQDCSRTSGFLPCSCSECALRLPHLFESKPPETSPEEFLIKQAWDSVPKQAQAAAPHPFTPTLRKADKVISILKIIFLCNKNVKRDDADSARHWFAASLFLCHLTLIRAQLLCH